MTIGRFEQLRDQLFTPGTGATLRPFSLRHSVVDRSMREREVIARHNCASNAETLFAQAPYITQRELVASTKETRKLALERWESEGGATRIKSPRADHPVEL